MTQRVLLTGAAGFAGSHVLAHLLEKTDWHITCIASWAHYGEPARVVSALGGNHDASRVTVVTHDLTAMITPRLADDLGTADIIMNIASDSHVDRSISDPVPFTKNNVSLMLTMLEHARKVKPRLFLQMGTDEVYGPMLNGVPNCEWDTIIPSNPYSAGKAAQDCLATAWWRTYQLPLTLTRTMNLFGPWQSSEKFIPMVIRRVLADDIVTIHSSPDGIPGSRHWIDVREFADAWLFLAENHESAAYPAADRPDLYHIVGTEHDNLEVAKIIADILGKPLVHKLVNFHASRPGHDLMYGLDGSKLAKAGWECRRSFRDSLSDTVNWYLEHPRWLEE